MVYERIFKAFFQSYVLINYYYFIIQRLFEDPAILHFSHGIGGFSEITQESRPVRKHYHFYRPMVWCHTVVTLPTY